MDPRNIRSGWVIPTENYCDQPYVVVADDGAWVVVVTTGKGLEGQPGQHVISMRSTDHGRTWSSPVDLEPADGPEASYAALLKSPTGRIFCFYNYNLDDLRRVKADFPGGFWDRVDSQGHHMFRWSDDNGKSWSKARVDIPIRRMRIDRENPYGGEILFFWNVGKPIILDGEAYLTLHKIGRFGPNAFDPSAGVLLHSPDLLTCEDPAQAHWETLPDGDECLHGPESSVSEEQRLVSLSDGSLFCVWRTTAGSPGCAYSRDKGHTWTEPDFLRYPDGRRVKQPRAANFVWKLQNGRYLYWFHNYGGQSWDGRNPAWLSAGTEYDAPDGRRIRWSDPNIVLYDPDPSLGISYPDLIEDGGEYYLTETQKTVARTGLVDRSIIEDLLDPKAPADGTALSTGFIPGEDGFTLSMTVEDGCGELLRVRGENGCVLRLAAENGRVRLSIDDGRTVTEAFSGLFTGDAHRVTVIVDAQAKVISFLLDGMLCDGGSERPRGWFALASKLFHGTADPTADILFFPRPLKTGEAALI